MEGVGDRRTATDVRASTPPAPLSSALGPLARCAWRTAALVARRRLRQPKANVGRRVRFGDGTAAEVYRETVIERPPPSAPAVLVVGFRLRSLRREWAHRAFRVESELNTILFAGFPGLVSKLCFRHDGQRTYRGLYQWDGPDLALAYVRALWWVLALVSERGSIRYAVLPGLLRDDVLEDPTMIDGVGKADAWWRPTAVS